MQHVTSTTGAPAGGTGAGATTPAPKEGGRACLDSKLTRHHPLVQTESASTPAASSTKTSAFTTTTTSSAFTASLEIPPYKPKQGPIPPKDQLHDIPLDILIQIALLLPCPSFAALLQTSKYIHYNLDTRWVWHQRFVLRLGRGLLIYLLNPRDYHTRELLSTKDGGKGEMVKDTSVVVKEKLVEWYWMYTRTAVAAKEMYICHRDDFWKFISDNRSPYGLVAKLRRGLWWLDVSANLYGVGPGRYRVQWGFSLSNFACVIGVQFRVAAFSRDEVPEWQNEAKNSIDYTPKTARRFLHHTNATNKEDIDTSAHSLKNAEALIFQLPQVLVVDKERPTLFVQMRNHGSYRSGVTVLFVRVVPVGEEEVEEEEEEEVAEDEVDMIEQEDADDFEETESDDY